MANLPITINSTSSSPAPRQANKPESAGASEQDFGNLLSRQVSDSGKPADSNSALPRQESKKTAEHDDTESSPTTESASPPSADMLSILLAQQNPDTPSPHNFIADATNQPESNSELSKPNITASNKEPKGPIARLGADLTADKITGRNTLSELLPVLPQPEALKPSKLTDIKEGDLLASDTPLRVALMKNLPEALPQAALLPAVAGVGVPTNNTSIQNPVTHPAWGDEFSQKVSWMATQHNQSASLHLNPPQLGPLDVILKMNGDQASVIFTSPHAAVRDAIEHALPLLRDMLAVNGIMLSNAMVSDQTAQHHQDSASKKAFVKTPNPISASNSGSNNVQESIISVRSQHNGMVDTFA